MNTEGRIGLPQEQNSNAMFDAFCDVERLVGDLAQPGNVQGSVEELRTVLQRIKNYTVQLKERNRELRFQAMIDSLTGLLNRRAFFLYAEALQNDCKKQQHAMSCLLLDIDYFKTINDRYGHHVGDRALVYLADVLHHSVRSTDLVCRYGGEEFAVFMPSADLARASDLAERLRRRVESKVGPRVLESQNIAVTASIGVASCANSRTRLQTLLKEADRALYTAKRDGRNRVRLA